MPQNRHSPDCVPEKAMPSSPAQVADGKSLGEALKAWRLAAGLTQEELASIVGYERSTVGHAEIGRRVPGGDFWDRADAATGAGGALRCAYEDYLGHRRTNARLRAIGSGPGPISLGEQALEAIRMASMIEGMTDHGQELDLLHRQVISLADAYFTTPVEGMARGLASARNLAAGLFGVVRGIAPLRRLHLLTARMTGVLAHLLLDTGDLPHAREVAAAAWEHAAAAADGPTMGWVRSVQSLVHYWSGFPSIAAAFAKDGAKHVSGGLVAVRLATFEAHAYGRLGNAAKVLAAIARAAEHRQKLPASASEPGGLMCFSVAQELSYGATALLSLGDMDQLPEAARRAERAVELMSGLPGPDPLAASLDLASARYLSGDLEGAVAALEAVVAAPAEARTHTIRLRATSMVEYVRYRRDALEARKMATLLEAIAAPALDR